MISRCVVPWDPGLVSLLTSNNGTINLKKIQAQDICPDDIIWFVIKIVPSGISLRKVANSIVWLAINDKGLLETADPFVFGIKEISNLFFRTRF